MRVTESVSAEATVQPRMINGVEGTRVTVSAKKEVSVDVPSQNPEDVHQAAKAAAERLAQGFEQEDAVRFAIEDIFSDDVNLRSTTIALSSVCDRRDGSEASDASSAWMDVAEEANPQPMVIDQERVPPGPPAAGDCLPYREDSAVHDPSKLGDQMMEVVFQHPKFATNSWETMLKPGDEYRPSCRGSCMIWR